MTEGITIPDTEDAHAEIWVTEMHNPFKVDGEMFTLLTVIPFSNDHAFDDADGRDFHSDVLDVAKSLECAYHHDQERTICIEVRFKNKYCNI